MATSKLAVFDLDGTLVDSRRSIDAAMIGAFQALGLAPPTYEQTRRIVGLSLEPALAQLAPDLPKARYQELAQAYRDAFVANRSRGLAEPLYDGARKTLTALREDGWLLGIATGKARRGVDAFFERHDLRHVFDCAFCAEDGAGKPDPHMLRLNMSATKVACADTIMIGDTSFDMAMARSASVHAQGVSWGFHTVAEIEAGGAHHVAHDFETLIDRLALFRAG